MAQSEQISVSAVLCFVNLLPRASLSTVNLTALRIFA